MLIPPDIRRVLTLMLPAAIAASSGSINVLVNTNFATTLETGSVTWLNYAFRLFQLPVGLFGVAIAAAVLPTLTTTITRAGNRVDQAAGSQLQTALELVSWLMVGCFIFLFVNHMQLVDLLFHHGQFSAASARATGLALQAYCFGVLGYGLLKVLTSFYFAVERTSYAMKVSLLAVVINFVVNWFLVKRYGHIGLATTAACTLTFNAALLMWGLRQHDVRFEWSKILKSMIYIAFALLLACWGQKFCLSALSGLDLGGIKTESALAIALNGVICVLVFGFFGLIRLGWSPAYVLEQIKNLRR